MSLLVDIEKELNNFTLKTSFECQDEIVALLGPSGAGKSMTLKCIAGIEKPERGRIVLNGRVLFDSNEGINLIPQKRKVGYLFQDYALFPNMTVYQNVLCSIRKDSDKYPDRRAVVDDVLNRLGIEEIKNSRINEISGGQKQRTALARIIVNEADILMLDEPFSSLDEHLKFQLQNELGNILRDYGKTVLFITHDRDEAYRLCDKIAIIDKGNLEVFGSVKEVFNNPLTVAGARLTGVKNIASAQNLGGSTIRVPDWNLEFVTTNIPEGISSVGIRMHSLKTVPVDGGADNYLSIEGRICEVRETPFTYVVGIRDEKFLKPLYFETGKDGVGYKVNDSLKLYIDKEDIMLLK